jgi:hypothetical protein
MEPMQTKITMQTDLSISFHQNVDWFYEERSSQFLDVVKRFNKAL